MRKIQRTQLRCCRGSVASRQWRRNSGWFAHTPLCRLSAGHEAVSMHRPNKHCYLKSEGTHRNTTRSSSKATGCKSRHPIMSQWSARYREEHLVLTAFPKHCILFQMQNYSSEQGSRSFLNVATGASNYCRCG